MERVRFVADVMAVAKIEDAENLGARRAYFDQAVSSTTPTFPHCWWVCSPVPKPSRWTFCSPRYWTAFEGRRRVTTLRLYEDWPGERPELHPEIEADD